MVFLRSRISVLHAESGSLPHVFYSPLCLASTRNQSERFAGDLFLLFFLLLGFVLFFYFCLIFPNTNWCYLIPVRDRCLHFLPALFSRFFFILFQWFSIRFSVFN